MVEMYKGRRVLEATPRVAQAPVVFRKARNRTKSDILGERNAQRLEAQRAQNAMVEKFLAENGKIQHCPMKPKKGLERRAQVYAVRIDRGNGKSEYVAAILAPIYRPIIGVKARVCGGPSSGHNVGT